MENEKRVAVQLTEAEISALIVTVNAVRVGDVHICRVKQLHAALNELRDSERGIQIEQGR